MDNNTSWENPLDPNGENYYPPVLSTMNDTTIVINDTVELFAEGSDSNGTVDYCIWSFDLGDNWDDTVDNGEKMKRAFSSNMAGEQKLLVRAVDNDGLMSSVDTVKLKVELSPPTLKPTSDMLVSKDSTVKLSVEAIDTNDGGVITQYYLDVGLDGIDDSGSDNTFELAFPEGGIKNYVVIVKDDDSNSVSDTFSIRYNRPPASLAIQDFTNNDTLAYESVNLVDLNGDVNLVFIADDPDSTIDTLSYYLYTWISNEDTLLSYSGKKSTCLLKDLKMAQLFNFRLVAKDIFGDSTEFTGAFYTAVIDIVNPVISLLGDNPLFLPKGFLYDEFGYSAFDGIDGDLTDDVIVSGDVVNTNTVGSYSVVYSVSDAAGNDTSVIREVIVEDFIMLENFESGKTWQSSFGALFEDSDSTGYWKSWSDVYVDGNTEFNPDVNAGTDSAFKNNHIENIGFDGGDAFNINVSIGEDAYYPYWGIGFFLKDQGEYYDLSGLDSLVFYAKGSISSDSGTFRVQFTYQALDSLWEESKWGYAGIELPLTENWKKVVIVPKDIAGVVASPGDGHDWEMIKYGINMIQFCEQPGADIIPDVNLFIDDIKIYGDFTNSGFFD